MVESFNLCPTKAGWAFQKKLESSDKSTALSRGIIGHAMLQAYFSTLMSTANHKQAQQAARDAVIPFLQENPASVSTILQELLPVVQLFTDTYAAMFKRQEILAVEEEYRLELDDIVFPFKVDMVAKEHNKIIIYDWKFVYNLYDNNTIAVLSQIPKYAGALRELGTNVTHGMYGFLRYRSLKERTAEKTFLLQPVPQTSMSPENITRLFRNHIRKATKLAEALQDNGTELFDDPLGNSFVCSKCSFLALCAAKTRGEVELNREVKLSYKPNTYGYV
jgi:hypothetical protein